MQFLLKASLGKARTESLNLNYPLTESALIKVTQT